MGSSLPKSTSVFLKKLFADESILKLGWSFNVEDLKMIRLAARGYIIFLHFRTINFAI